MERHVIAEGAEVWVGRALNYDLPPRPGRSRIALITQPGEAADVAGLLSDVWSDLEVLVVEVPDRDAAKDLEIVGGIYDRLADFNLGRSDTIVGVGGGAVTDMAGFVAATWLRGVESVLVPTTLLGAVDASIGGKTGINRKGKNLVGAFWHPSRVFVDLDTLDRLPESLKVEGSAEIVKAGLIREKAIVEAYAEYGPTVALDLVVPAAIAVKTQVVAADFRETGERILLNFGHTIGHAVETLTGMAHGYAVSVGMVAAGYVSAGRFGFDSGWLTDLLFSLGLPVAAAGIPGAAALDLVLRDKKRTADGIRMVLLRTVGDPVVDVVSEDEILAGLDAIGAI